MPKPVRFVVTGWPRADLLELDADAERRGGGRAHATRSSRGKVLLSLWRAYQARRREVATAREEIHGEEAS